MENKMTDGNIAAILIIGFISMMFLIKTVIEVYYIDKRMRSLESDNIVNRVNIWKIQYKMDDE